MYTFKPDTTTSSFRKSPERKKKVHGEAKEVNRMIKARVEKQVMEKAIEKGLTYNVKEITKIRKKVTDEIVQQILTKKVSDKFQ
jgi:hypothetical protein